MSFEVGDSVVWYDHDIEKNAIIYNVNDDGSYDILLLQERNVMFESIYTPISANDIQKGDIVLYKKKNKINEALIDTIDWASSSMQVRFIIRNIDN